jgi:hypothetical protein
MLMPEPCKRVTAVSAKEEVFGNNEPEEEIASNARSVPLLGIRPD